MFVCGMIKTTLPIILTVFVFLIKIDVKGQSHILCDFPPTYDSATKNVIYPSKIQYKSLITKSMSSQEITTQKQLDSLLYIMKLIKATQDSIWQAKEARPKLEKYEIERITLYGGGSFFNLAQGKNEDNNIISGSLGINVITKVFSTNFFYSFNNKDSVTIGGLNDLGRALMTTNRKGQSLNLNVLYKPYNGTSHYFKDNFAIRFRASISDQIWKTDSINAIDASPITSSISFVYIPFEVNVKDKPFRTTVEIGGTFRAIKGDFNNQNHNIESQTIHPRGFNSIDLVLSQYISNIQFYVNTTLSGRYSSERLVIPGYTGTQVMFGLNVSGGITSLYDRARDK